MKVLITGGCGFQGSHLAESYAKEGHEIIGINTPSDHARGNYERYLKQYDNISVVWGSCTDAELVDKSMSGCDMVFHLAGKINVDESIEKPWDYAKTNLNGAAIILEAVHRYSIPLIHASTCEVYGGNLFGDLNVLEAVKRTGAELHYVSSASIYGAAPKEKYLMSEYHPIAPQSPYAASKAAGDRMVWAYICTHKIRATIVRPFNIYGPRQKSRGFGAVIPIFFRKAMNHETLIVNGDGSQTRDYLYISDLIEGYRLIAATPELRGKVVNLGSSTETSIRWLAEWVKGRVPGTDIKYGEPRPGEVDSFIADNSTIAAHGFAPKVGMNEGMERYYDWLTSNKNH